MRRIWLASSSPRRRQLLAWVGFTVDGVGADVDETPLPGEQPVACAMRLARMKAEGGPADALVVAADTVVHLGGVMYGKPVDRHEAGVMLGRLSGRSHEVTTGVCVRRGERARVFAVNTAVRFRELSDAEIDAYVATGEADDKAGAYGIQGRAGAFVAEVRGCWTNVMGLPVEALLDALRDM